MVYRPTFRGQLDNTECEGRNCNCCSHGMAAQRYREGRDPNNKFRWPPHTKDIRDRIQFISERGCGGTSLNQNDAATHDLYEINMDVRYNIPWASFKSMIISGRGAVVPMLYSVVRGTKYNACPGFYGNHAIYVNERRPTDGRFLVYDPLADHRRKGIPQGPMWWPPDLLKRAMMAYPGTNAGCVHASFTKDTE